MPAQDFDATRQPQDVVAALSLEAGKSYTCQNVAPFSSLFVREDTAAPSITARGFRVESGGVFTLKISADPIYLWTDNSTCAVIVVEAVD